ncbi:aminotransferase class I/II-fold pyridoxal phosphate-dependent enzyme [Candidatus Kaiserbacteria bacterium]|nr:aminotransferase class I/II-fold pyridoxal phosphate-dependent enzyme [Candidatus Kaiserbacteria bacterium]
MTRREWQTNRQGQFPEYVHARLAKEVVSVERISRRKVLNLGIGSPDIPPSKRYLDKLSELIRGQDAHLYPGYGGTSELKHAICDWYKKRFDVDIEENEVVVLLGAKDGIAHLPFALADAGDEILVPDPGYPAFSGSALLASAKPVPYSSLEEIEKKISDRTAFIWVNFPSNPTGAIATKDQLAEIVATAKKHDVPIAYDNAYSEITFDGYVAPSVMEVEGAKDIAIELGSFSKTFSFAGYRMGWAAGNRAIIAALAKVKSQTDSGMPLPLQRLGAFALRNQDMEWHKNMLATYQKRRDIIAEKLTKLGLTFEIPKGSLYLWANIPDSARDAETYCMALLKERNVLFTSGSAFGAQGERHVRVSISSDVSEIDGYL